MQHDKKPTLDNPAIPEGINTGDEHPLKEFFWLLTGVVVFIGLLVAALSISAGWLAKYIPFKYETQIVERFIDAEPQPSEVQQYLQDMADRLAAAEDLPEEMRITVHYDDSDTVNAFATLGGHVFFFRGLIEALPNEDALAMVMAHEIAHIKHRHPVRALGRGVTIGIALSALAGVSGSSAGERLIGDVGLITSLSFSRGQESEADLTALAALVEAYGHAAGAIQLFDVFADLEAEHVSLPAVLRTHPLSDNRRQKMVDFTVGNNWAVSGESKTYPAWLIREIELAD